MVLNNSNGNPLQLPTTPKSRFEIVGGFALLHLAGGATVAVDATRVVAITPADVGVRALILDCGGAVVVKCTEDLRTLAKLIDAAARALEGD